MFIESFRIVLKLYRYNRQKMYLFKYYIKADNKIHTNQAVIKIASYNKYFFHGTLVWLKIWAIYTSTTNMVSLSRWYIKLRESQHFNIHMQKTHAIWPLF